MIEVCQQRFPELARANALHVADATSLKQFSSDSFDLVFFSFNGIDYRIRDRSLVDLGRDASRDPRWRSHASLNAQSLLGHESGSFGHREAVVATLFYSRSALMRFRWVNGDWRQKRRETDHLVLKDGTHGFHLRTYYITPTAQIRQLVDHGYSEIQVITNNGRMSLTDAVDDPADPWVHFWSRVRK